MSDRTPISLAEADRALSAGTAVVLPNPAPLTHVVAGRHAPAVNEAKGRPSGQAVALWAHHPETLRALDDVWALPLAVRQTARLLLSSELLTVLLPVHDTDVPPWLSPAVKDGWMLLFGARWEPLIPLLDNHPILYVSSANRTGHPPAATSADALAMFPAPVPVLATPEPSPTTPRRATTTIRVHPDGRLELHRPGAQDAPYGNPEAYLAHLRDRHSL